MADHALQRGRNIAEAIREYLGTDVEPRDGTELRELEAAVGQTYWVATRQIR